MKNDVTVKSEILPASVFADLGEGKVAYLRRVKSEDLTRMFPDAPPLVPGMLLWTLSHANGRPILISDTREAAVANAYENDLTMVNVH